MRRRAMRMVADLRGRLTFKLTLLYGTLFVLVTILSLAATRAAIERYAEETIRRDMQTGSAVFDRITTMQLRQLNRAAMVLAGDFGFREAAATGDGATIASALASLRDRFQLDRALFVGLDGSVAGDVAGLSDTDIAELTGALDAGREEGVIRNREGHMMAAAAPVRAPMPIGWVVFANDLGASDLRALARLTSVDLHPRLVDADGPSGSAGVRQFETTRDGKRILVQERPIPTLMAQGRERLRLEYSLTQALGGYAPILTALLTLGVMGALMAIIGAYLASCRLTRPIVALESAARKVSAGEYAKVSVETRDEIGRLAQSFNRMVDAVEQREAKIAHMAFHDALTGLPNRTLLREQIAFGLQRADERVLTLFCIDIDNFKAINETLGHHAGDAILCRIGERLADVCPTGFIARLAGDQFAIKLRGAGASDQTGRAIVAAIGEPFDLDGQRILLSASVGIALSPQDGADAATLLKNSELALNRAKDEGKGNVRFFEAAMDAEAQARRALETDLHDALRRGELELHFQPLFSLKQNRVTAFEALLRWRHPERGMVSPVQFIPLAEESGLIVPIGEWVVHEACRVAAQWPDHIRIAVNISPVQFRSPNLASVVLQALARSGLAPGRLELEVTESLFIDDVEGTLSSLHGLRALGVRVALDDFGTGYSSLSYLRSFPFDKLKIDRSFIVDLLEHQGATAIIRAITTLADALGIETTAEGVENSDQLDILEAQGCGQIQGYFFSRPIPAQDVAALLDRIDGQASIAA